MNMLWRALEGVPEGVDVDTYAFVTQVFKNIALAKVATQRRGGEGVRLLPPDRRRVVRPRAPAARGQAARRSASRDAGYHPPAPRAYKLPGESGIATLQMMVNTLVAGKYASEHDAKIAMKLANVLCGGVGGAHARGHRGRDPRARARSLLSASAASR